MQAGAKVIDRPEELSGDFVPTVAALQHVAEALNLGDNDNIILLQATNPLRPKNLLKEAMEIYTQNNYKSLFTVSRDAHKLGKIKTINLSPLIMNLV